MFDREEVVQTVQRLQSTFEDLSVRGLRSCGPEHLTALIGLKEEFDRIGAAHLAGRIETVIANIKADDRGSAASLMRAQASLRVFERILTLEAVTPRIAVLCGVGVKHGSPNGDEGDEDVDVDEHGNVDAHVDVDAHEDEDEVQ